MYPGDGRRAPERETPMPLDTAKLTELADLRDSGVLTEDEFQTQKKILLGQSSQPSLRPPRMQRAAVGATPVVPMPVATATPMPIAPVTPVVASVGGSQGTGHWVDKAAIVAKVRAGQCIHGEQVAVPYANACEFNPAAMTGCYCIKCGSKSGIPVGLTYNFFLGPWFCFQPCLPLPLWCGCSDEREGNVYINRGKWGGGTVMVIDEEMGTLACYCEEEANPCCTCVKIGK